MGITDRLEEMGVGYLAGRSGLVEGRPTLVMLHGAGGTAGIWQSQVTLLDHAVNTLALDLPGHGNTGGEGFSEIGEYSSWLREVLESAFQEPVFLMGHSMGGAVVQEAAIVYPRLLAGIVLVSTGPRMKVGPMFLEGFQEQFESTVDSVMRYAYSLNADRVLVEQGAKLMKSAGPEVVHGDFSACDRFDGRDILAHIDLPCLILCGGEDRLTPPKLSQSLQKGIDGSVLEILPGAGHMIMIEKYKELNHSVLKFISSLW